MPHLYSINDGLNVALRITMFSRLLVLLCLCIWRIESQFKSISNPVFSLDVFNHYPNDSICLISMCYYIFVVWTKWLRWWSSICISTIIICLLVCICLLFTWFPSNGYVWVSVSLALLYLLSYKKYLAVMISSSLCLHL